MYCFVYITFKNEQEAQKIAASVVEKSLAACANIMPQITSLYRWQGATQSAAECAAVFKTESRLYDALQKEINRMHSYEVPCIAKINIEELNQSYGSWISQQLIN